LRAVHTPRYREMLRRLRRARQKAGLIQIQVAKALRRTQAYVSKCELGERRIDPLDLFDFARLYRKPMSHFVPESAWRR
jgi:transcriptional regulator with XRE-family HTH domain